MSGQLILVSSVHNCVLSEYLLTGCQVTGSTGFIGCHIVEQLLENGYRVRAYVIIVEFWTLDLTER